MNAIVWILLGAITGWLTGKLIGEKGYANQLLEGYTSSLDIFFGVVGASIIGGYIFFWSLIEDGSLFSNAAAILGSISLVAACRLVSERMAMSRDNP